MSGLFGQTLSYTQESCNKITGRTKLKLQTQQSFNCRPENQNGDTDKTHLRNTALGCFLPMPSQMEERPYQICFSPMKFCNQLWEVLCDFAGHHLFLKLCHDFILQLLFGISPFLYILTDGQQFIQMSSLILKGREDRDRITTTVWGRGLNICVQFKRILLPSNSSHHLGPVEGLLCLMENASIGARLNLQGLLPWKALGNQFLCCAGIVLWTAQDGDKRLILLLLLPDRLSTAMDVHF